MKIQSSGIKFASVWHAYKGYFIYKASAHAQTNIRQCWPHVIYDTQWLSIHAGQESVIYTITLVSILFNYRWCTHPQLTQVAHTLHPNFMSPRQLFDLENELADFSKLVKKASSFQWVSLVIQKYNSLVVIIICTHFQLHTDQAMTVI